MQLLLLPNLNMKNCYHYMLSNYLLLHSLILYQQFYIVLQE